MSSPPDLLNLIVQNTIAVMTTFPKQKGEWWNTLCQMRNKPGAPTELLKAVLYLLLGDYPADIQLPTDPAQRRNWERILTEISQFNQDVEEQAKPVPSIAKNNFSQEWPVTCPICGHNFITMVSMLVNSSTQPELMRNILAGTMHEVICPKCGQKSEAEAPLLIFRPEEKPPVIFSPTQNIDPEESENQAQRLLEMLRQDQDLFWRKEYERVMTVPRQVLAVFLRDGPEAARLEALRLDREALEQIRQEDPQHYEVVTALRRLRAQNATLLDRIQNFIQTSNLAEKRQIVEDNPQLLQPEVTQLIEMLAKRERARGDEDIAQFYDAFADLLKRCHEVGITAAFAGLENNENDNPLEAEFERLNQLQSQIENHPEIWEHLSDSWEALILKADEAGEPELACLARGNLANALIRKYEATGSEPFAHHAEALFAEVNQTFKKRVAPQIWANTQHSLGTLFFCRYQRSGDEFHADAAQSYLKNALQEYDHTTSPSQWATIQHTLGNLLTFRYELSGNEGHAEAAQINYQASLEVHCRETAPVDWAKIQYALGTLFTSRYDHSGDEIHADAAQNHFQNALQVYNNEELPNDYALTQHALGNLFHSRYDCSGKEEYADAAQSYYQNALQECSHNESPILWATFQYSLGNLFSSRYERSEQEIHASSADGYYQNALEVRCRELAPIDWAMTQFSLGSLFLRRYERSNNEEHANASQSYFHNALKEYHRENAPAQWALIQLSLGNLFLRRCDRSGIEVHGISAHSYYQAVVELNKDVPLSPIIPFRAAAGFVRLAFRQEKWQDTSYAYTICEKELIKLLSLQTRRSGKEDWLGEFQGMPALAAFAMVMQGQLENALIIIENGRALLLAEALDQSRRDLERLPVAIQEPYRRAAAHYNEAISFSERFPAEGMPRVQAAQRELQAAIASVRSVQDFEDFLQPVPIEKILEIAKSCPLVYLVVTSVGGLALIVHKNKVEALLLDVTDKELNLRLKETRAGKDIGGYLLGAVKNHNWLKICLPELLEWIGKQMMNPIAGWLKAHKLGQIVLIPTGMLGLLPLHAAIIEKNGKKDTFLEDFIVRYAPSAKALRAAYSAKEKHTDDSRVLIGIGNPLPAPYELYFARAELEEAVKYFSDTCLLYDYQATKSALLTNTTHATHIHLSCHGQFNPIYPLKSSLLLANGEGLTLSELLEPEVSTKMGNARLVVLSACQTAMIDFTHLADEMIGMPNGFLQAGILGVVGTLWSVNELSTALVMAKFYEFHFKGDGDKPLEPAEALRRAQTWLRHVTREDLLAYFEDHMKGVTARFGKNYFTLFEPNEQPYIDKPYHWAPFVYVGI